MSRTLRFGFSAALLVGCAPEGATPSDAGTFVAFAPDFAGYSTWSAFDLGDGGTTSADAACVHTASVPRLAFLNAAPAHGATEFPVGTIIVKEIHVGAAPSSWQVIAMVKRGGGYDPGSGCVGWEWFGVDITSGTPTIQWRGVAPPSSEVYATCGACSSCHSAAASNDCVLSPELSLSQW